MGNRRPPTVTPGDLSILPPPAAIGGRGADGYRRTTLEEAARLDGYQPVVPAWLPAGFTPAEVGHATQYRSSTAAFAGARAERTIRAWYGRSHFWALNDQLSLLVQGDVTVEEMQRIVESLKPL